MSDEAPLAELIRRIRAGEQAAWSELVRRHEADIRRLVRHGLSLPLRRLIDSMDVCQSVMRSFFRRASLGKVIPETPEELARLLAAMARNKLRKRVRREQAAGRDYRRVQQGSVDEMPLPAPQPEPDRVAAAREQLARIRALVTPEEWLLLEMHHQGYSWQEIADRLGGSRDALRMRYSRLSEHVAAILCKEGSRHDPAR